MPPRVGGHAPALDLQHLEDNFIDLNDWVNETWVPPPNTMADASDGRRRVHELYCTMCKKHLTRWDVQDHCNLDKHQRNLQWAQEANAPAHVPVEISRATFPPPPPPTRRRSRSPIKRRFDMSLNNVLATSAKAPPPGSASWEARISSEVSDPAFDALRQDLVEHIQNIQQEPVASLMVPPLPGQDAPTARSHVLPGFVASTSNPDATVNSSDYSVTGTTGSYTSISSISSNSFVPSNNFGLPVPKSTSYVHPALIIRDVAPPPGTWTQAHIPNVPPGMWTEGGSSSSQPVVQYIYAPNLRRLAAPRGDRHRRRARSVSSSDVDRDTTAQRHVPHRNPSSDNMVRILRSAPEHVTFPTTGPFYLSR